MSIGAYDIRVVNDMVERESAFVDRLMTEVHKVIVGQDEMIERVFMGLLCGGHVLLEGAPGLAKTLTVATLARAVTMDFNPTRLNFFFDAGTGLIREIRCG